ncbi:predicted protein [Histoplasma capsulatum G186AR]|uniref:Uncharacterized protein n=1 Tax=Ajellomyces capsulatus (strain G186AR / H82 / ATCC MYA-2454 / RMSCC 2432) TaxID=447093 RepID=C0NN08_AJECG|nr:uncharacterized protein HCBG_04135 [Histoplasma capsulatum G186AR]EEH07256.1 predicted protein [Histoplasma capsulatum G186AR]
MFLAKRNQINPQGHGRLSGEGHEKVKLVLSDKLPPDPWLGGEKRHPHNHAQGVAAKVEQALSLALKWPAPMQRKSEGQPVIDQLQKWVSMKKNQLFESCMKVSGILITKSQLAAHT